MADVKYNGWTNYETWCVNLWIGNEEGSSNYWDDRAHEVATDAKADTPFTRKERAMLDLSDELKDTIEESAPEIEGLYADLLNAAMGEVNWYEIAEGLLEEEFANKVEKGSMKNDDHIREIQ